MPKLSKLTLYFALLCGPAAGQTLNCDLQGYKPMDGLKAETRGGVVNFYGVVNAARNFVRSLPSETGSRRFRKWRLERMASQWMVLANTLQPEFHVTSGKRRMAIAMQRNSSCWASTSPRSYTTRKNG